MANFEQPGLYSGFSPKLIQGKKRINESILREIICRVMVPGQDKSIIPNISPVLDDEYFNFAWPYVS